MNIAAVSHVHMSATPTWHSAHKKPDTDEPRLPGAEQHLSKEEQAQVEKLKARDREVRAHEQAHLAAAGGLAVSAATYSYQRGPDGVQYAIGGEVKLDTSPGNTPEETLRRAQIIRAAALAPAEPSGQDRIVAANASKMESEARAELATQEQNKDDNKESAHRSTITGQPYNPLSGFEPGQQVSIYA